MGVMAMGFSGEVLVADIDLEKSRDLAVQPRNRQAALPHRRGALRLRRDDRIHHHRPRPRLQARARRNARGDDAIDDHPLRHEHLRRGEAARADVLQRLLHVGGELADLRRGGILDRRRLLQQHRIAHLGDAQHGHGGYPLGLVQVSDQASTQLDEGRPPRSCGNTLPGAAWPLTESCAPRAGMKVLYTPSGRFIVPGGMVSTKGAMKSHQVRMISSLRETMRSSTALSELPVRSNFASTIGSEPSANGWCSMSSMVRCKKRATPA